MVEGVTVEGVMVEGVTVVGVTVGADWMYKRGGICN